MLLILPANNNRFDFMLFSSFGDMFVVVDAKSIRHLERAQVQVHICLSDGNVLEGFNSRLPGFNRNANLFLSVFIPISLKKFGIFARSFLDL